jgi:DNA-binding CsgD family transcriptional regulator
VSVRRAISLRALALVPSRQDVMVEVAPTVEAPGLFERSVQLSALTEMLAAVARTGRGRLALVYGEAGIGKTALVRRFSEEACDSAGVFWGKCDELFTPRPLGPLFDMAGAVGGGLAEVLERDATPYEVATVVVEMLVGRAPTIVVLEDVHLADEATLDVLRILGVRAGGVPALVIVTYRDDVLERWHPLRIVLGEVAAASTVERVKLACLSPDTVASMAAAQGVAGGELYRRTAGNPFFVTEVLAAWDERIPETVRDAVLGRAARLSPGARRLLDGIAVARTQCELWLLEAFAGEDLACLEEAIASGIVNASAGAVSFRHELARLAVEEAIPPHRRRALHRLVLELLANPPGGEPDPARLAHHAGAVGDGELVLRFAPVAASQASKMGAHREAASHYRRALRFGDLAAIETRARLFAGNARESFLSVDFAEAASAQREALHCYEELGDRRRQAAALSFLGQLLWQVGSLQEGLAAVERSLVLLDGLPGRELVAACCQMASLQLAAEDPSSAMRWARRAQETSDRVTDPISRLLALQAVGWVEFFTGAAGGIDRLTETVETAKSAGLDALAAQCYVIIARTACRRREYGIAEPYIQAGLEYCTARDFDVWRYYLLSWQSKVSLARGRWSEAAEAAQICLAEPCPFARIHALVALGLVRARRGDPDVWGPLDEALTLAEPRHELQWIAPVAIARAEAAWLEGRTEDAIAETEHAYEAAAGTWYAAGLGYWRWRAGADEPAPVVGEEQYRLEMAGEYATASERWRAIGCPYEAAFALLDADEAELQSALGELQRIGANPAAKIAAARLRKLGVRGVPRGPRPRTRKNPAGLTARELEVLPLLAEGLRNAQIALRLVVSEKTVDHHVSAILRKLDVRTRGEASAEAMRLGLLRPS